MALQLRGKRSNITLNLSATFVAIFALVAQPLVALNLPSVFAAPIINEVMPDPVNIADADGEWVEIHNQGSEATDVSGWTLSDNSNLRYTFASSTTLSADQHFVICSDSVVNTEVNCDDQWNGGRILNNDGDTLTLNDGSGDVDSFTYDDSDVDEGKSIEVERVDNTKVAKNNTSESYDTNGNTGTPGVQNTAISTGSVKNENTGETFTTIQAAINDEQTNSGDTIKVAAGTYNEDVQINKSISLVGAGRDVTTINGQGGSYAVEVKGNREGVIISGFTVNGSTGQEALKIEQSSTSKDITVEDNILVSGDGGHAVYAGKMSDSVFKNNIFKVNSGETPTILVYLMGDSSNVDFTNNYFVGALGAHMAFSTSATGSEFSGNDLSQITQVGKDKLVEIKATTDASAGNNTYPNGWAVVNPEQSDFKGVYRLQKAVDTATNGDEVVLTSGITIDSDVDINNDGITLDGAGYTISANFPKQGYSNNSALSVGSNDVTVRDLTLDGANGTDLHGVNAYEVENLSLYSVTAKNFRAGLIVNGSTVTADNFSTSGNSWYAANIDQGSGVSTDASLKITGTSSHDESAHIVLEDSTNTALSFDDFENQYSKNSFGNKDVYNLKADPFDQNQLNVSGMLYRDHKLNDCDNRTECLDRSSDRLENWEVRLYKEDVNDDWQPVKTAQTNADGVYKFGSFQNAGTYHVCFVQKDGWEQTAQTWSGSGYLVNTPAPQNLQDSDDVAPFCATSTYADTSDRSWKQNIGNVDTGAPVVDINTPTAGKLVKGKVEIKGSVTDNHKLKNYYLTIVDKSDNSIVHTKNYPTSDDVNGKLAEWDSDSLSGDYRVIIEARDAANNKDGGRNPLPDTTEGASIDYVDVVVDNEAPVGELTAIGGKAYSYSGPELIVKSEGGKLVVTGEVEDSVAMNRVGVQLVEPGVSGDIDYVLANDNGLYGDTGLVQWEAEFDTDALAVEDGRYALNIAYVDKIGNVSKEKNLYFVLDNTAPDATISTDPSTTDGDTVSGAVEVTGSVDQEKHIKSHWFEITDPNGEKTYEYDMNTADKSFSFTLDTSAGDGEYKIRYVATDHAGNRSDSSEPTTYMLVVDNGTTDEDSGDTDNDSPDNGQNASGTDGSGNDNTTTTTGGADSDGPIIPITPLQDEGQQPPLAFLGNNAGNPGAQAVTDDATDEDDQDVLSSEDNQQNGEVTNQAANSESEVLGDEDENGCWKLLGLCWYWWIPIVAAVVGIVWFIKKLRDEDDGVDTPTRRLQ